MIGFSVWGKGGLRLFCVVAGMAVGYLVATALGVLGTDEWARVSNSAWFDFPLKDHPGWSFDSALLLPFLLAMLGSSLKGVGDLTTCQKINDVDWKRPDMTRISRGILANSLGTLAAGLLGGVGQSTSSSNVGLSIATGATSRIIAYTTSGFLLLFAFCPKLSMIFVILPDAIMGATLIFVLSFMIAAGIQIIASRMLDNRKVFVVGVSLLVGLGVDVVPDAFAILPAWLQTLFSSSLSTTLVLALGLNLIFRLGISSRASLELRVGEQVSTRVFEFMQQQGARWGARPEVIRRATLALDELMEGIRIHGLTEGPITVTARFDELSLDLLVHYRGSVMVIDAHPPSPDAMLEDPDRVRQLIGYLIRQYSDRAECVQQGDVAEAHLHFDH
jgi:NCS2 family nucleobase:cation symporter-2